MTKNGPCSNAAEAVTVVVFLVPMLLRGSTPRISPNEGNVGWERFLCARGHSLEINPDPACTATGLNVSTRERGNELNIILVPTLRVGTHCMHYGARVGSERINEIENPGLAVGKEFTSAPIINIMTI